MGGSNAGERDLRIDHMKLGERHDSIMHTKKRNLEEKLGSEGKQGTAGGGCLFVPGCPELK